MVHCFIFYRADFPELGGPSPRDHQLIDVSFGFKIHSICLDSHDLYDFICAIIYHLSLWQIHLMEYFCNVSALFEQCRYGFGKKSTTKLRQGCST
jgi:hypothetical protein